MCQYRTASPLQLTCGPRASLGHYFRKTNRIVFLGFSGWQDKHNSVAIDKKGNTNHNYFCSYSIAGVPREGAVVGLKNARNADPQRKSIDIKICIRRLISIINLSPIPRIPISIAPQLQLTYKRHQQNGQTPFFHEGSTLPFHSSNPI